MLRNFKMGKSISKEKRRRRAGFGFSSANDDDMISQLPDSLISEILLCLPTKEAIRTSVLSYRWKNLWLLIPGLHLSSCEFQNYNAFVSFMDKLLDISREQKSCLHKVKLSIKKGEFDRCCVRRWIDFLAKGKLQHLDVECLVVKPGDLESMPLSLYICESLVYLRLHRVWLGNFESSVSLPCLKTMRLERNEYVNEACLESLISSCHVLEDLSIVRRADDNVKILRVHSQTLTSLGVEFDFGVNGRDLSGLDRENSGLVIDAPRLKYLNFKDELSKRKIVSNLGSLDKVSFDGFFDIECHLDGAGLPKNQIAREFFNCISGVRDMIFTENTMTLMSFYLKVESLPQFCNLSYLEAEFCAATAEILPVFLQSCPNLKTIILDLSRSTLEAPISCTTVPQCLLSSLEFVEMKSIFRGSSQEKEVASFFVENSVVIKKLLVHLSSSEQKEGLVVLRYLLSLQKPSSMCQIVYVTDDC